MAAELDRVQRGAGDPGQPGELALAQTGIFAGAADLLGNLAPDVEGAT